MRPRPPQAAALAARAHRPRRERVFRRRSCSRGRSENSNSWSARHCSRSSTRCSRGRDFAAGLTKPWPLTTSRGWLRPQR
jgi:hypothetical protein